MMIRKGEWIMRLEKIQDALTKKRIYIYGR